jgi:alanine dehydrogenase
MSLFLSEKDVEQLLSMPMALEAVEAAHRDLSSGQACDVPRQRTRLPQTTLHILQGALPQLDAIGYKAYTSNRSGVRFLVHLYRASSGSLRAVIEADLLGMMRTGAASGSCDALAGQADAQVAGVFGAGWQAEGHIEALARCVRLLRVKVYARHAERWRPFAPKCPNALASR